MKKQLTFILFISLSLVFFNCEDNKDFEYKFFEPSGKSITYDLGSKDVEGISGTVSFVEIADGSININFDLSGTPDDGIHPAHIHFNTAAEGGDIALSLAPVNGDSGNSTINVTALDDGTPITYDELLQFDGYINVHLSSEELSTIVAQGDIGQNDLTDNTITYDLATKDVEDISGTATFTERNNGEILGELSLEGTPDGGVHPAHIHENSAIETGGILLSFSPVNGDTGKSFTNITGFDDGSSLAFSDIADLDAYINVHLSATELSTIVAQGDIGENDLNGNAITYDLGTKDVEGISGTATFSERNNGEVLAELALQGTPDGGMHPAHIHENTAVETGGILLTFTPVNGDTGISLTNITKLDNGTALTFSDISELDAYINVHLSVDELSTIVAQGDIGQNDLTGNTLIYDLGEKDVDGISGTVTFFERENGEALAELNIMNTPDGGVHPTHIHENTAAEGGGILFTFTPVDGNTGKSLTNVTAFDNTDDFGFADIDTLDAYINVHLSANELATIVAQGDIGRNVLTGVSKVYELAEKDVPNISGTASFFERKDGSALAVLELQNTPDGGSHPAHIHMNDAATGGPIAFTFNPVNGTTGKSETQVEKLDDDTDFFYDDILSYDGYINVHLSAVQLAVIVAQGNIGSNE